MHNSSKVETELNKVMIDTHKVDTVFAVKKYCNNAVDYVSQNATVIRDFHNVS